MFKYHKKQVKEIARTDSTQGSFYIRPNERIKVEAEYCLIWATGIPALTQTYNKYK